MQTYINEAIYYKHEILKWEVGEDKKIGGASIQPSAEILR